MSKGERISKGGEIEELFPLMKTGILLSEIVIDVKTLALRMNP